MELTQRCARCRREAPDQASREFVHWEAIGDGTDVLCPGCITGEEQRVIDEDAMQLVDDAEFDEITKRLG